MILKGSQRQGARQLAAHLLNLQDNDHVTLSEIRGFMSNDLYDAMAETEGLAKGTKCRQSVFSLSLNPPKDAEVETDAFTTVADRAEATLGLKDQPRAIVIHEKNGRKHAHVVWSRIDPTMMTAVNLPYFKTKLAALSKELYLENGWDLPEGHKANGWKNPLNFSLAEWQQSKRIDMDPREIKQMFQTAWQASDNLPSFRNALEEQGFRIAKGDRRSFVAVDLNGEVFSISRYAEVKPKELNRKFGPPDALPTVSQAQVGLYQQVRHKLRDYIRQDRQQKADQLKPLEDQARNAALSHRSERVTLQKFHDQRWQKESRARAARFRQGVGVVLDVLTGRWFALRRDNAKEAVRGLNRDKAQREQLIRSQLKERGGLQQQIDALKSRHQKERQILARQIAETLKRVKQNPRDQAPQRQRNTDLEM